MKCIGKRYTSVHSHEWNQSYETNMVTTYSLEEMIVVKGRVDDMMMIDKWIFKSFISTGHWMRIFSTNQIKFWSQKWISFRIFDEEKKLNLVQSTLHLFHCISPITNLYNQQPDQNVSFLSTLLTDHNAPSQWRGTSVTKDLKSHIFPLLSFFHIILLFYIVIFSLCFPSLS